MERILEKTNAVVWGMPVLFLILTVGILFSIQSRFAQIRLLPYALQWFFHSFKKHGKSEGISGYKALCTALAATVGTGNIAGVAGAIAIGGPGVVFWMWICALFGMVTKLAEVTLAIHYRTKDSKGEYIGGPMYLIHRGLPGKYRFFAFIYAFFGIVAAFGVGNATQVNAVVGGMKGIASIYGYKFGQAESIVLGVIIGILIIVASYKGADGIGNWAEKLVPAASIIYILLAIGALCMCRSQIPDAVYAIVKGAFSPRSVTCGVIGSFFLTVRIGASRGVFTNEAGMGTASIAHASAKVNHPVEQGLMGIVEVFLDTIVICTLTALVILCSGITIPYGTDPGIALTMDAFSAVYGDWSTILITVLVSVFAFATILGWGLYGIRCAQFLFGENVSRKFIITQAIAAIIGVALNTSVVWLFAELVNGLMAIPNLIALFTLAPEFIFLLKQFIDKEKRTA